VILTRKKFDLCPGALSWDLQSSTIKSSIRELRKSVLKQVFDHKKKGSVDLRGAVKFLFDQRDNLIGDMLVNTIVFRAIKNKYPAWQVHVLAGPGNGEVVRDNPCVDKVHTMSGTMSSLSRLRREKFDIYYFHKNRLRLQDFLFLKYTGARINIGRNKEEYRLFDHSLEDPGGTERDRYLGFLRFFAIDGTKYGYEFPLRDEDLAHARSYLSALPGQNTIVFNRYGSPRGKLFSKDLSCKLITEINLLYPDARIIMLCPPEHRAPTLEIKRELGYSNVYAATQIETIRDSAAIIRESDSVVTTDTSIVHIACAYDKPQVCVYRDQDELDLWRPFSDRAVSLLPVPPSRDVNDVDMNAFRQALARTRSLYTAGG
jgi:ADP-heptose:LPS heptosyltransferase